MYLDLISHYRPLEVEVSEETGEQVLPVFFRGFSSRSTALFCLFKAHLEIGFTF